MSERRVWRNNSTLAQIHGCIPIISVDERNNQAMSANQSSNLQETLCLDVTVIGLLYAVYMYGRIERH